MGLSLRVISKLLFTEYFQLQKQVANTQLLLHISPKSAQGPLCGLVLLASNKFYTSHTVLMTHSFRTPFVLLSVK